MNRGASWATVHGVAESDMTERLTHNRTIYMEKNEKVQNECLTNEHLVLMAQQTDSTILVNIK